MNMSNVEDKEENDSSADEFTNYAELLSENEPLPPVAPGFVRLYRGDRIDGEGKPLHDKSSTEAPGRWFTDNPNSAEGYAGHTRLDSTEDTQPRHLYIDIPEETASEYNGLSPANAEALMMAGGVSGAPKSEWLLPQEIADQALEYKVEHTETLYEDGTEDGLMAVFQEPEVASYLKRIGITGERLTDAIQSPVRVESILLQIRNMLGERSIVVTDPKQLRSEVNRLDIAIGSANKRRYVT